MHRRDRVTSKEQLPGMLFSIQQPDEIHSEKYIELALRGHILQKIAVQNSSLRGFCRINVEMNRINHLFALEKHFHRYWAD